ncbi:MAG: alpha/beta hydrolase [Solirubrobacteraceae bacterium]|nr:alpha/beta hydrolase [Patulibacter sp.]
MTGSPSSSGAEPLRPRREVRHELGGRPVRALESGKPGSPVALLLHGLPGSAEDWNRLGALLAADFHVVAIDRPGYGGSGPEALPVEDQVELYAAVLREVSGVGPALVAGHSYGAVPAALLASRHPDLVGALGLLAPALRERREARELPPGLDALGRLVAQPAVAALVRGTLLSEPGRALLAKVLDPTTFAPDPVDEEHLAGVRERTLRWDAIRSAVREGTALVREGETVDQLLPLLDVPAAVIHAAGDRVVSPNAGRRTAHSIPGCALHELEGGHMLTVSRAGEVAPLLRAVAVRGGLLPS